MKKIFITLITISAITVITNAQTVFTVKPGLNLNGANIGYQSNNLVGYFGLQFFNIKDKSERKEENDDYERVTKIHVYMPYVGGKFFVYNSGSLKSSINASIFKPLVFGKQTSDGEVDDGFKKQIKSIQFWGGELGFGTEYFLSEQFSIGGEFGIRIGSYKEDYESDENSYYAYTLKESIGIGMTYVSASMNFYFKK